MTYPSLRDHTRGVRRMAKINWSRVVLGGLLGFVVFNVIWVSAWNLFLGSEWKSAFAATGRALEAGIDSLVLWLVLTMFLGIICIWIYAAIRAHPQYGAGPMTAFQVAVVVWLLSGLGPTVWYAHMLRLPGALIAVSLALELLADVAAVLAGAWLYREQQTARE